MKKRSAFVMIALASLGACSKPTPSHVPPSPDPAAPIAGGWSQAGIDADVTSAATFAAQRLDRKGAKLLKVNAAEQQVVAGMNFKIDLTLTDKSSWRVTVFRNLDGVMELTSSAKLQH
jgi:uncharacterized protein involved in outer membrane biogenesis